MYVYTHTYIQVQYKKEFQKLNPTFLMLDFQSYMPCTLNVNSDNTEQ